MNTNIEVLNLEGNAIDEDGAICLTKVLRENFFITELVSFVFTTRVHIPTKQTT